ncbi:MAG: glycoside hydrolase family 3 N-terminal domain-containing protein [Kiritimatiellia bacterium]
MAKSKRKTEKSQPPYRDPSQPVAERVNDLLGRMTLEEKIMQMGSRISWEPGTVAADRRGRFSPGIARRTMGKTGLGQLCMIQNQYSPSAGASLANSIQRFAEKHTRLGIPPIIHHEALHGLTTRGCTSFPQAIALASSWDPDMMLEVSSIIGRETISRGIRQVLSPTINIARDPRCGRTEETYGEDPLLTSRMVVSFVKGVQAHGVVATPKHFVANFAGSGGRDSHEIHFSERILREIYFPAFEAAVKEAGALSIMAAYNSLDGKPCSSDAWLLRDVLRNEWGFKGYVVSDYNSVIHIHSKHRVAPSDAEAGKLAAEAGLDVELPASVCFEKMISLARRGLVSSEAIDECVRNILRVKFMMGMFDDRYVDPKKAGTICDPKQHRAAALKAAEKGMVLLKNRSGTLPFDRRLKSLAVIGPNAAEARLGGYSGRGIKTVSPLAGIRKLAGKRVKIRYSRGCGITGNSRDGFDRAMKAVRASDAAVLVMGNAPETEGEDRDRCCLDLPGVQEDLILEAAAAGKPVIVVLINGSAVTMERWVDKAQAILEAWYPGEEGGTAIAETLFGRNNPAGRLPITFPIRSGQLPLYYNDKPSGRTSDYADLRGRQAMFPFGHGLSYTTFAYSSLRVTPSSIPPYGKVKVKVDVRNTGKTAGDEVVQLYLTDLCSSVTRPVMELKGFRRISLSAGSKKTVAFELGERELRMLDTHLQYVVEPGAYQVMVGSSSAKGLKKRFEVKGK